MTETPRTCSECPFLQVRYLRGRRVRIEVCAMGTDWDECRGYLWDECRGYEVDQTKGAA